MGHEKGAVNQEPDAWVPAHDVFGFREKNQKAIREQHEMIWQTKANKHNRYRTIGQKLTRKGKETAAGVRHGEALAENAQIDAGETPDSLKHAELGQAVLEEAGIEQKHFPTRESLIQAELDSPVIGRGQGESWTHVDAQALADVTSRAMDKVGIDETDAPLPQNPYTKR